MGLLEEKKGPLSLFKRDKIEMTKQVLKKFHIINLINLDKIELDGYFCSMYSSNYITLFKIETASKFYDNDGVVLNHHEF